MADSDNFEIQEGPHDEGEYPEDNDPQPLDPYADPWAGGGMDGATWWMGGLNLATNHLIWPKLAHTRRPTDFRSASIVEDACQKGLGDNLKLSDNPKSKIGLTSWIATLKQFLEETRQDTVFWIYNPNEDTKDYILDTWNKCKKKLVDDWVELLHEGVRDLPVCCWKRQRRHAAMLEYCLT